ncbi:Tuberous sclerosis protein [Salix suchowensis]|nr:Tuberous sclerosis protein [Salix suchowensis]
MALSVFDKLLAILKHESQASARSRLAVLQFIMRLRADRDHHLYYVESQYDRDGLIAMLANLWGAEQPPGEGFSPTPGAGSERLGEDSGSDPEGPSACACPDDTADVFLAGGAAWGYRTIPLRVEAGRGFPFRVPSLLHAIERIETLISYDPEGPDKRSVLPVSSYLRLVEEILEKETDWEILSYLYATSRSTINKHLFCGPKSRDAIAGILKTICTGILNGGLASTVEAWPSGLKTRDAQGLAYHTLSVLVSYRRCFDMQLRHLLVEVFQAGLNGHPSTIKCCLHALTLSAFELQPSMTKCLSRILEKLSQIMSNPEMAVHILGFLSVVGSLNALHANFTEADFKMVFGVALQYLQHHNQNKTSPTISWALSQHVRILSFYIVYVWFLAVKIPDRPRHVKFITRQLLLANEGNRRLTNLRKFALTGWRVTHTRAPIHGPPIRYSTTSLERAGWVEVLSRRPSGLTKILCRIENVPLTNAGEVSGVSNDALEKPLVTTTQSDLSAILPMEDGEAANGGDTAEDSPPPPDPVTGYVWSGSAPSQRRKDVVVDPAFLVLQLSAYPDQRSAPTSVGSSPRHPCKSSYKGWTEFR